MLLNGLTDAPSTATRRALNEAAQNQRRRSVTNRGGGGGACLRPPLSLRQYPILSSLPLVYSPGRYSSSWEPHLRATGRHLPYGITQCYLPPDTSERPLTLAMQAGTPFT